ncbi:CFI-box-CTERM domain-containing protein [Ammoniphilus sp. CFH 90114]|uniref:CFI-box-CTERM domain-containing protein n=1 Tax=Ammoniphilus sp. CFH 90114 TaxID=2493665 RepID=UPI00100EB8F0|nr:CFI-box-CTERM domain-containing protein [Ammoniphilus sp. CFH 90114]RXT04527.1 PKD domain-containing protein [Ammoniphilus sp. CFH 90114]
MLSHAWKGGGGQRITRHSSYGFWLNCALVLLLVLSAGLSLGVRLAEAADETGNAEIEEFSWVSRSEDKVSSSSLTPDSELDGRFSLTVNLPEDTEIESIDIQSSDANGNPTGQWWTTRESWYWIVGVFQQDKPLHTDYVSTVGTFSGQQQFDLYVSDSGYFRPGNHFLVEVVLGDGSRLQQVVGIAGIQHNYWGNDNEGKVNKANQGYYGLNSYFFSDETITDIEYRYSVDQEEWQPFDLILSKGQIYHNWYDGSSRQIYVDLMDLPEGTIYLQATATNESGESFSVVTTLTKDTISPENVMDLTVEPTEDQLGFNLNWTNPTEDFKHVYVQRREMGSTYWSTIRYDLTDDNYMDKNSLQSGVDYSYRIMVVDPAGNESIHPIVATSVIPVEAPVFQYMSPAQDYHTNEQSIHMRADVRDDQPVETILFEFSTDGENWTRINPVDKIKPTLNSYYYWLYFDWDASALEDGIYQIRATATDAGGRTSTNTSTVTLKRALPETPNNFTATIDSTGIDLNWDAVDGANYYRLERSYANTKEHGTYTSTWYIYSPNHSYKDQYAEIGKPYVYTLYTIDTFGNIGKPVSVNVELYEGPTLSLEGGYEVASSQSEFILRGKTEPEASVTVNGTEVVVGAGGEFSYNATLADGVNTFTVEASNDTGTNVKKQRAILDTQKPYIYSFSINNSSSDNLTIGGNPESIYLAVRDSASSGIERVQFQVSQDDGLNWIDIFEFSENELSQSTYWENPQYLPYWYKSFNWDTKQALGTGVTLADGSYKFRMIAHDKAGNSSIGTPVRIWTLDNTSPSVPGNIIAEAGVEQVKVKWDAVTDADLSYYRVYRSTTSGEGYIKLDDVYAREYIDNQAYAGTFYYVVSAVDQRGNESLISEEVMVQPSVDDKTPVIGSVNVKDGDTVGGSTPTISFYTTDDSPRGVAEYEFEYSADEGTNWKVMEGTRSGPYRWSGNSFYGYVHWSTAGLNSGDYLLQLTAKDHSGNISMEQRSVTLDVYAAAPTGVVAETEDGMIMLNWEQTSDTDFQYYQVLRSDRRDGSYYSRGEIYNAEVTTFTDKSVNLDQIYYYKLRFVDKFGNYADSSTMIIKVANDTSSPEVTAIEPVEGSTVGGPTISFSANAIDNKAVTSYEAFYSSDNGQTWSPANRHWWYSNHFYFETAGLSSGSYKILVKAYDEAGNMGSKEVNWTLDLSISVTQNVQTASEENHVIISWDANADEDINDYPYHVKRSTQPDGPYEYRGSWLNKNTLSFKDTGLLPGTTYYYVVETRDRFDNRSVSTEATGALLRDERPPTISSFSPKDGVTIGGAKSETMYLYFQDNAGVTGSSAQFEYSKDGTNWISITGSSGGPNHSSGDTYYFYRNWDLTALSTDTYSVRYSVYDGAGNLARETASYQVDRTPPANPQNLIGTYGSQKVTLNWEPPADADVDRYHIHRATSPNGPFSHLYTVYGRNTLSYTDAGVVPELTYYYKVTAVDKFSQEGEASNMAAVAAKTDVNPPVVLGIEPLDGTVLGPKANITVRAEDDLALSSIKLQYSIDGGSDWITISQQGTRDQATFAWDTGTLSGEVKLRAIAYDSVGNSSDGTPIRTYTIDKEAPEKVEGLRATPYMTSVLINWKDVAAEDFAYFQVERKDQADGTFTSVGTTSTQLGLHVQGLGPNQTYWFRVVAYDKLGNRGIPSDELQVTTEVDTQKPVVTSIQPNPGYFDQQIELRATATDNVGLDSITFQYSVDKAVWNNLAAVPVNNGSTVTTVTYNWDVSALAEGVYFVRGIAKDTSGNESTVTPIVEYRIDHSAPQQPMNFAAVATSGYIAVSWEKGTENDLAGYRLYRSTVESGEYAVLAEDNSAFTMQDGIVSYRDRAVDANVTYYYKVAAKDLTGSVGEAAGPIAAQLEPDHQKPEVVRISPTGGILPLDKKIHVLAEDNFRISNLTLEYKAKDANNQDWTLIGTRELDVYGDWVTFDWNTSGLANGAYTVRAIATDKAGNVSDPHLAEFSLKVEPPVAPVLTATPGGWKMSLSWTAADDAELAGFYLKRGTQPEGPYTEIHRRAAADFTSVEGSQRTYTFEDEVLRPGRAYSYVVEAVDIYGNMSQSAVVSKEPLTHDPYKPTAIAGDEQVVTFGMEVAFDGTQSFDNNRISRYLWDFGDGTTAEGAQPKHIYQVTGSDSVSYPVTLAVYDPAGNSAQTTTRVTLKPVQKVGELEVKVVTEGGSPISSASVVIEFPDGTSLKKDTDSQGIVRLVAEPGNYKVYAYKPNEEYLPAAIDATVALNELRKVTLQLKQGKLVIGDLNHRRLGLEEIRELGIDETAPENQWVYKFEVHLAFNNQQYTSSVVTNQTRVISNPGPIVIQTGFNNDGGNGDGGWNTPSALHAYPVVIPAPANRPEVKPTVAYMVVPGEARWLKEFFEVSLSLENKADPIFVIDQAKAKLILPEGLSLAPTKVPQTLEVDVEDIAGQEKKTTKWIIRGDKKGEYELKAEFNGRLQPFDDPVHAIFKTDENNKLRVWGEDALKMFIEAQDRADEGHPYVLRVGLKNVSDTNVYNPAIELKEENKQNYIYAPNQELVKTIATLESGQTFWTDYYLVPSIKGNLDVSQSFVLKTGGNATVPTAEITPISRPENIKGVAPVVEQVVNAGKVSLTWPTLEAEGATGYRIYKARPDQLMSGAEERVAEVGAGVSSYADLPAGNYFVTTMFGNHEVLRHAVEWYGGPSTSVAITVDPMEIYANRDTELTITANKGGYVVAGGKVSVGSYVYDALLDSYGQASITIHPTEPGDILVTVKDTDDQVLGTKTIKAIEAPPAPTAPAAPTGLRTLMEEEHRAVLGWNENTEDNLAGYYLYQLNAGTWSRYTQETVTSVTYEVYGLDSGTSYTFAVSAINTLGLESDRSVPYTFVTPGGIYEPTLAYLSDLRVNGMTVTGFVYDQFNYSVTLPHGASLPMVEAAPLDVNADVTVTQASELPGTAIVEVTAADGSVRNTYTVNFTVEQSTEPILIGITVDMLKYPLAKGETHQTVVHANYSDGSTKDITGEATYQSSNEDWATVDSNGLVTATGWGHPKITVSYGGFEKHVEVTMVQDECFIATAAFGSKFMPAVTLLRAFRDEFLLTNPAGQAFVKTYYTYSPPIAQFIAESEFLKGLVRVLLSPIVAVVYLMFHPILFIALLGMIAVVVVFRRMRFV